MRAKLILAFDDGRIIDEVVFDPLHYFTWQAGLDAGPVDESGQNRLVALHITPSVGRPRMDRGGDG